MHFILEDCNLYISNACIWYSCEWYFSHMRIQSSQVVFKLTNSTHVRLQTSSLFVRDVFTTILTEMSVYAQINGKLRSLFGCVCHLRISIRMLAATNREIKEPMKLRRIFVVSNSLFLWFSVVFHFDCWNFIFAYFILINVFDVFSILRIPVSFLYFFLISPQCFNRTIFLSFLVSSISIENTFWYKSS